MPEQKIEHLIILMLENRAFDHMLGYLEYPKGTAFEGLAGKEKQYGNPYDDGKEAYPRPEANYGIHTGPNHNHESVMEQLMQDHPRTYPYQMTNRGFAADYEKVSPEHAEDVLKCFKPEHLPVLSTLAKEFAVCDHWYSSVPGETWPNRNYAHSANSDGEVAIVFRTYHNKTIYEQMVENQRDWTIYYGGFPPQSMVFTNLWRKHQHKWIQRFQPQEALYRAIQTDHLPHYAFVEPDMLGKNSDSQHPSMGGRQDFMAGEHLIWRLYHELRKNQVVFDKTLLIVTYDEHGGFFDHVAPPQGKDLEVEPHYRNPSNDAEFPFNLLGLRVPLVMISPWISPGRVIQTVYEHASIPATIRKLFQIQAPALSARDAQANTFEAILDRDSPRKELPDIEEPHLDEEQHKSSIGVPLRESLAWVLGKMIWQTLEEGADEVNELFNDLEQSMGIQTGEGEDKQKASSEALKQFLDSISPELSDAARDLLKQEEELLGEFSNFLEHLAETIPLTTWLRFFEVKLQKMLDDDTLEDDAQKIGEPLFHLFGNPIVILHRADGVSIDEPSEADLKQALQTLFEGGKQKGRVWLANSQNHWLDIDVQEDGANGRATLYDKDPEETFSRDGVKMQQALELVKNFQAGKLEEVRGFVKKEVKAS